MNDPAAVEKQGNGTFCVMPLSCTKSAKNKTLNMCKLGCTKCTTTKMLKTYFRHHQYQFTGICTKQQKLAYAFLFFYTKVQNSFQKSNRSYPVFHDRKMQIATKLYQAVFENLHTLLQPLTFKHMTALVTVPSIRKWWFVFYRLTVWNSLVTCSALKQPHP